MKLGFCRLGKFLHVRGELLVSSRDTYPRAIIDARVYARLDRRKAADRCLSLLLATWRGPPDVGDTAISLYFP